MNGESAFHFVDETRAKNKAKLGRGRGQKVRDKVEYALLREFSNSSMEVLCSDAVSAWFTRSGFPVSCTTDDPANQLDYIAARSHDTRCADHFFSPSKRCHDFSNVSIPRTCRNTKRSI